MINPFQANVPFLYLLKTSENIGQKWIKESDTETKLSKFESLTAPR